jgi:hypothetical protein
MTMDFVPLGVLWPVSAFNSFAEQLKDNLVGGVAGTSAATKSENNNQGASVHSALP